MTATMPELDLAVELDPPIRCDGVECPDGTPIEQGTPCADLATWDVLWGCAHAAQDLSHLCDRHKELLGRYGPPRCPQGHPVVILVVHPRRA